MSDYYRGQKGPNDPYRSENAGMKSGDAGASFLTEDPAQLGTQMQQGGVPLPENGDFLKQGDDAPTRVARPVIPPQMVTKHVTVDKPE